VPSTKKSYNISWKKSRSAMNKKPFRLFALLAIGLLSSCSLPYRDVSPLTSADAEYNYADYRDYRQVAPTTCVIDRTAYSLVNYNPAYAKRGFLEIQDSKTGLRGIFSLLQNKVLILPTYQKFSYVRSASNGTYIKAFSDATTFDLYDYRGFKLKTGLSSTKAFSIKATTETLRYQRKHLIEVITYDGVTETNEVYKDGSRKAFIAPCDLLWVDDTGYIPGTSELSDLAMEGCVGTIQHDATFTVTKGEQVISSFKIPRSNVSVFMWKCFFYQYGEETTLDNYDFLYQGKPIKLHTCRVELATGKTVEISTNLLMSSLSPIYSNTGQVRYALASGIHFKNHEFEKLSGLYVIDNNVHEYWNASDDPCYDSDAYKLDWNIYFAPNFGKLINYSLTPYFTFHTWELKTINYTKRVFCNIKGSTYGVLSFAGVQLIEPTYDAIFFARDGSSTALGYKDNTYYTLDFSKNTAVPHLFDTDEWGTNLGNGYFRCHGVGYVDGHSYETTYYRNYAWDKIDYYSWAIFVETYELSTFFDYAKIDAFSPLHEYDYYTYEVFKLKDIA
jgi:hypothetical protein